MRGGIFSGKILRDRRGASTIEYGIILAMIVFGLFAAVGGLAKETLKMWSYVDEQSAKAHNGN